MLFYSGNSENYFPEGNITIALMSIQYLYIIIQLIATKCTLYAILFFLLSDTVSPVAKRTRFKKACTSDSGPEDDKAKDGMYIIQSKIWSIDVYS